MTAYFYEIRNNDVLGEIKFDFELSQFQQEALQQLSSQINLTWDNVEEVADWLFALITGKSRRRPRPKNLEKFYA